MIDGDGSLNSYNINGYEKFNLTLTGTTELVGKVSRIISDKFECKPVLRSRFPERDNNNITMSICGNNKVLNICKWLYEDSNIFMQKKYDNFVKMCDIREVQLDK